VLELLNMFEITSIHLAGLTSWLNELALSSFKRCNFANIHEAGLSSTHPVNSMNAHQASLTSQASLEVLTGSLGRIERRKAAGGAGN